jgi:hypothetical protein
MMTQEDQHPTSANLSKSTSIVEYKNAYLKRLNHEYSLSISGRSIPRIEAKQKRSEWEYIHHFTVPGMLYNGKIFRSTIAHERF